MVDPVSELAAVGQAVASSAVEEEEACRHVGSNGVVSPRQLAETRENRHVRQSDIQLVNGNNALTVKQRRTEAISRHVL